MFVAIDIGNSNIVIGIDKGGSWQHQWRLETHPHQHNQYYLNKLQDHFLEAGLNSGEANSIILSSVVPALTKVWQTVLEDFFQKDVILVNADIYPYLPIHIHNPYQIGSDLVANAMAAYCTFPENICTVVDFGTALTFTSIGRDGKILGVAIAPGLKTAIQSLNQNTAQLPEVPLEMPVSALGMNTIHAIQSGVLLGYTGLVKYLTQKIQEEIQEKSIVIGTGGLSFVFQKSTGNIFDYVIPTFTLDGLRWIESYYQKNSEDQQKSVL
jgi:type III pantothenate kinase